MSSKTKIVVFHLKELVYTAIFAGLGVLLIILFWWMFSSGENRAEETEDAIYIPGVYSSSIQFNDNALEVEVIVDENHINDISFVNLEESVAAMYPLMEPALEAVSQQIYEQQSTENITGQENNQYTTEIIVGAIDEALEQARVGDK